ncbi:MAG: hypothetical protein ACP5FP_01320 [Desulfuromonadaceae bacterium]
MKTTHDIRHTGSPLSDEMVEKYSCAVTLSDLEIFVYPELLYSLVLANIMSPLVWEWRDDPWFAKLDKLNTYRRILRLKQFIMDRYDFNLDLDSWGLTRQEVELNRFKDIIDTEVIERSNALFGYTGDKYYFDMNIRRHFGLDKYDSDVIPYWKTETVEAMDAFKYREGYSKGAGECVSLSTLYAAALYVVCGIPLEKIYLMATPLHSQNFVDVRDGIITNNRRIVTRNMWFNGTALTARAQRALRNEQVTMVAHNTGYIHVVYPEASIDPQAYTRFSEALTGFMRTDLDEEILCNFLRQHLELQRCFQLQHERHGKKYWVALEKVYRCEHGSSFRVGDRTTRDKLLDEVDEYDFFPTPLEGRIDLGRFEKFFKRFPHADLDKQEVQEALLEEFDCCGDSTYTLIEDLRSFIEVTPRLPELEAKQLKFSTPAVTLEPGMERAEVLEALHQQRERSSMVDLAFYAYRDMNTCAWEPFILAALERNPVCVEGCAQLSDSEVIDVLQGMTNESIYTDQRLAQPDEVWNFRRGDGVERALCLAAVLRGRRPQERMLLEVEPERAVLTLYAQKVEFKSCKGLRYSTEI